MLQIKWEQPGKLEMMEISADKTDAGWMFSTKGKWEISWNPLPSTADLVATAEQKLQACTNTIGRDATRNYSVLSYRLVRTESVYVVKEEYLAA